MATTVKQMLEAAQAAVPKISSDQAADMINAGNTLVLDVRDAPEVPASGKIAGALNVCAGCWNFEWTQSLLTTTRTLIRIKP